MTAWVVEHLGLDVPMHFTAFHPDFKMLDIAADSAGDALARPEIALGNGVRYAYTGNVHDTEGGSTSCPSCGEVVVERDWYVARDVPPDRRRTLPGVRRADPRTLRRAARHVGRASRARAPRDVRGRTIAVTADDESGRLPSRDRFYPDDPDVLARRSTTLLDARARGEVPAPEGVHPAARRLRVLGPDRRDGLRDARAIRTRARHARRAARPRALRAGSRAGGVVRRRVRARRSATCRSTPSAACRGVRAPGCLDRRRCARARAQPRGPPAVPPAGARRRFALVPLVVGHAEPEIVAAVLDLLWGGPETRDRREQRPEPLPRSRHRDGARHAHRVADPERHAARRSPPTTPAARHPIRGLLVAGARRGLTRRLLDLRNSGDTAGPRDRVVGYGAFALEAA